MSACSKSDLTEPAVAPRQTYEQSRGAIQTIIARDAADPLVAKTGVPRFYEHGRKVKTAVVLFHGFTNSPQQFDELARGFFDRGCNVYVPRIPYHGLADRLTREISNLGVALLQDASQEAYALGTGLGESVAVVGLSLGGSMAMWLAQTQPVDHAVPISPFLMPFGFPRGIGTVAMGALNILPDMYWWWDPRVKTGSKPDYAYPGFTTHALAELVFFGNSIFHFDQLTPRAKRLTLVTNSGEPAVNNNVPRRLLADWKTRGVADAAYTEVVLTDLGSPRHDIIDPTTFPEARKLVYPRLEAIVLS